MTERTNTITVKTNTVNQTVSLSYKSDSLRSVNNFTIHTFAKGGKGIQATASFGSSDKVYKYNQKIMKQGKRTYVRMTGMNIYFDLATLEVTEAIKMVEVSGKRRGNNGGNKPNQSVVESITEEIASNGTIEVPEIEVPTTAESVKPENVVTDGPIRHAQYDTIKTCLECGLPVYLGGPAGAGKNYTVEQIAKELGWDFYFANSVQDEFKLTGYKDANSNYNETEFYQACVSEKDCIFFLDEIDASTPEVLVLLNAAIANGYFNFPVGRVEFDHVHFVAAGNTMGNGADDMYTGRMSLDGATLDRFVMIEFDYDERVELSLSNGNRELVDFMHAMRETCNNLGIRATFSYRAIISVTKLEGAGMALDTIIRIAVVKGIDNDTLRTIRPNISNKYTRALLKVQALAA